MEEIWKPIEGYEGLYEVSNHGRVKSVCKRWKNCEDGKIKKQNQMCRGNYCIVTLYKEGEYKRHRVHRLVAFAFVPNPDNKPHVNHIDENTQNNRFDNLEWCTPLENNNHGSHNKKISIARTNNPKVSKPVECYTRGGEFVTIFPSVKEAERQTGVYNQNIFRCVQGKVKTAGGYIWRFCEE